ncbi:tryptophan-rich sensory protein [Chloroflexota bacterium]
MFFSLKLKREGIIIILPLWILILVTIIASFPVSGWASALLIPRYYVGNRSIIS